MAKRQSKDELERHYTPDWAVRAIVPVLRPWLEREGCSVLDPCCGHGSIGIELVRAAPGPVTLVGIDIDPDAVDWCTQLPEYTAAFCLDFLAHAIDQPEPPCFFDITGLNPPFSLSVEFALESLRVTKPDGVVALLQRLNWRRATIERRAFWEHNPCDMYVLDRRPSFSTNGKTDAQEYCWFVWDLTRPKSDRGRIRSLQCEPGPLELRQRSKLC